MADPCGERDESDTGQTAGRSCARCCRLQVRTDQPEPVPGVGGQIPGQFFMARINYLVFYPCLSVCLLVWFIWFISSSLQNFVLLGVRKGGAARERKWVPLSQNAGPVKSVSLTYHSLAMKG